jgi:hypothetical protein
MFILSDVVILNANVDLNKELAGLDVDHGGNRFVMPRYYRKNFLNGASPSMETKIGSVCATMRTTRNRSVGAKS